MWCHNSHGDQILAVVLTKSDEVPGPVSCTSNPSKDIVTSACDVVDLTWHISVLYSVVCIGLVICD